MTMMLVFRVDATNRFLCSTSDADVFRMSSENFRFICISLLYSSLLLGILLEKFSEKITFKFKNTATKMIKIFEIASTRQRAQFFIVKNTLFTYANNQQRISPRKS